MQTEPSIHSWETMFSKCLQDLKKKFPTYSESQIAEQIKISRATLNRYYNESSKPSLDNYLKVIVASGNHNLVQESMGLFDDVLKVALTEEKKEIASSELEALFENRDVFVVYMMASNSYGVTRAQILDVLGNAGIEALNILLKKELALEEEGRICLKQREAVVLRSFGSIKYHLDTYSKFYKTEHVGKKRNYAHSMTDGLNEEGIHALQNAHKAFHAEAQKILRDDKYKGLTPVFSVAYCDSLTSINNQFKEEHWQ